MGIAQGLRKNRRLRILNLSGNRITVHGAEALAEALQENNSLQELRLGVCNDDDSLAVVFCRAFNLTIRL